MRDANDSPTTGVWAGAALSGRMVDMGISGGGGGFVTRGRGTCILWREI